MHGYRVGIVGPGESAGRDGSLTDADPPSFAGTRSWVSTRGPLVLRRVASRVREQDVLKHASAESDGVETHSRHRSKARVAAADSETVQFVVNQAPLVGAGGPRAGDEGTPPHPERVGLRP